MTTRILSLPRLSKNIVSIIRILVFVLLGAGSITAQTTDTSTPAEAHLRETLRTTLLQLRSVQNERVALQTTNDGLSKEKIDLQAQLRTIAKQAADEQEASRKAVAALEKRLAAAEAENKSLTEASEKWQKSSTEATALACSAEAERARLAVRLAELERLVADREAKNVALFKTGSEILNRLERFGLGEAIKAREPFVGTKRVELQNLVQGYGDKLLDGRVTPGSEITTK